MHNILMQHMYFHDPAYDENYNYKRFGVSSQMWFLIVLIHVLSVFFTSIPTMLISYKRKYVHEVLVNCLFKLTQKKVCLGELTVQP